MLRRKHDSSKNAESDRLSLVRIMITNTSDVMAQAVDVSVRRSSAACVLFWLIETLEESRLQVCLGVVGEVASKYSKILRLGRGE